MRKILIVFISIFVYSISLYSQNAYRFQGRDIQLTVDSTMYYIQTTNEQSSTKRSEILKQKIQEGEIKSFHKLSNNRFLIIAKRMPNVSGDYISNIYKNEQKKIVMVLPRIAIMLKEGTDIKVILKKYFCKIDIENGNRRKFILKCNTNKSEEVLKITNELSNRLDVDWCEPELLSEIQAHNTLYPQQYYLYNTGQNGGTVGIDINVAPVWNITNGSSNIVVAVIDQGVDRNHEDIGNRVIDGYTIRNPLGLGAPQNENNINPKGHGTACAGIIGASNNTIGIRGIASNVKILPINIAPDPYILDSYGDVVSGYGSNIEIAQAINWAWHRADVLSNSWGGDVLSNEIVSAIDSARIYGRNGKGSIVVFSSGNNYPYTRNVSFPGNANGVITVGAINNSGTIWNYSQRGASMDIVAPSGNVQQGDVTTTDRMGVFGYNNNGNYSNNFGGTSAACPQVAGVAALMLSINPDLTETQVRTILQNTARDLGVSGFDNTYGYGLVNAYAAVNAVLPSISGPTQVCPGEHMTFTIENLPQGATVVWNQDTPITRISSQGLASCTFTSSVVCSGDIYINITVNGISYIITKNVTVGSGYYNLNDFTIQVYETSTGRIVNSDGPECLCENQIYDIMVVNNGYSQVSDYNWSLPSYWTINSSNGNTIQINTGSNPEGNIDVSTTNPCGYAEPLSGTYLYQGVCGGYGFSFSISPNPALNAVTVSMNETATMSASTLASVSANTKDETAFYSVKVVDSYGVMVYSDVKKSKQFIIPTASLRNGIYTIIVSDKNKFYQRKLMVQH